MIDKDVQTCAVHYSLHFRYYKLFKEVTEEKRNAVSFKFKSVQLCSNVQSLIKVTFSFLFIDFFKWHESLYCMFFPKADINDSLLKKNKTKKQH